MSMTSKQRLMLLVFKSVGFVGMVNVIIRFLIIVINPMQVPLIMIQLITELAYLVHLVTYFKFYKDSIPILTIIVPTLLHGVFSFLFKKTVPWVTLLGFLVLDCFYIVLVAYKASYYPFVYDGDDNMLDIEDESDSVN